MCLNRPPHGRNYSGEQKVNFEPPVPFSKCLRAKIYSNMNVYFDPKGCQTLLVKESEPLLFTLGSWTIRHSFLNHYILAESSTIICWANLFVILRVSGKCYHFYSI